MVVDPAQAARKRRKEILRRQDIDGSDTTAEQEAAPTASNNDTDDHQEDTTDTDAPSKISRTDKLGDSQPNDTNKKTPIRYDPEVPMPKEQLAAWRREARRVRNRESAAASRQRIRSRITELESEVAEWKARFLEASTRLEHLEAAKGTTTAGGAKTAQV